MPDHQFLARHRPSLCLYSRNNDLNSVTLGTVEGTHTFLLEKCPYEIHITSLDGRLLGRSEAFDEKTTKKVSNKKIKPYHPSEWPFEYSPMPKDLQYTLKAIFTKAPKHGKVEIQSNFKFTGILRLLPSSERQAIRFGSEMIDGWRSFFSGSTSSRNIQNVPPGKYTFALIHSQKIVAETKVFHLPLSPTSLEFVESASLTMKEELLGELPIQTKPLEANILDWSEVHVCMWMNSLNLSREYSSIISSKKITGSLLMTLTTKEDWKALGITAIGDLIKLIKAAQKLRQTFRLWK